MRHFLVILILLPTIGAADTVTLAPVRDNTLFEEATGALSSGGGSHLFCGNNSVMNTRRTVLAFDVAAVLPAGATVDSVGLNLHVSSAPNETPRDIAVHRLSAAWGEGASVSAGGAGAPSETGDATWLHTYFPDQTWAAPGGDFLASHSAVTAVGGAGAHNWAGPGLVADVQFWLENPGADFGWVLLGNETSASTVRRFDSREGGDPDRRPRLIIHYTPSSTSTAVMPWGSLKSMYLDIQSDVP